MSQRKCCCEPECLHCAAGTTPDELQIDLLGTVPLANQESCLGVCGDFDGTYILQKVEEGGQYCKWTYSWPHLCADVTQDNVLSAWVQNVGGIYQLAITLYYWVKEAGQWGSIYSKTVYWIHNFDITKPNCTFDHQPVEYSSQVFLPIGCDFSAVTLEATAL